MDRCRIEDLRYAQVFAKIKTDWNLRTKVKSIEKEIYYEKSYI